MRTTLTIKDDVAALLERMRKTRHISLKKIVNEALRAGLVEMAASTARNRRVYHTRPVFLGRCFLPNLDDTSAVLSLGEAEDYTINVARFPWPTFMPAIISRE